MTPITVLVDDRALTGPGRVVDGSLVLEPAPVWRALGPAGEREASLAEVAAGLDRPVAVDVEERAAVLGVSARVRGARLASLEAPEFSLPDLEGRPHTLAQHRGQKVFLVAYASW